MIKTAALACYVSISDKMFILKKKSHAPFKSFHPLQEEAAVKTQQSESIWIQKLHLNIKDLLVKWILLSVNVSTLSLCGFFFFFALLFPEMTCQSHSVASAVTVGIFFSFLFFFWCSYFIWSFTPAISVDANRPILLLLLFLPIKFGQMSD